MTYIEYWCDVNGGNLYRREVAYTSAVKPGPTADQILLNNITANPNNAACFVYQEQPVLGTPFVTDVAITLTVQTADCRRHHWPPPAGNQSAPERFATQRLQRLAAGRSGDVLPRAADASERHGTAGAAIGEGHENHESIERARRGDDHRPLYGAGDVGARHDPDVRVAN
jgi:hypothetical protein